VLVTALFVPARLSKRGGWEQRVLLGGRGGGRKGGGRERKSGCGRGSGDVFGWEELTFRSCNLNSLGPKVAAVSGLSRSWSRDSTSSAFLPTCNGSSARGDQ